jgi:hypothetical protein
MTDNNVIITSYYEVGRMRERQAIVEFLDQWQNGETKPLTIEQVIDLIENGKYL